MTWRCAHCDATTRGQVRVGLDPRWGTGFCLPCRSVRTFVRHDEPATGMALRDAGIDSAASNADSGSDVAWRIAATEAVKVLVARGVPFTQDDVTDVCGLPSHRNATGSLLSGMARSGLIERVGDTKGKRDSQHARRISVWRRREDAA